MKFRLTDGSAAIKGRSSIRANPIEERKSINSLCLLSRPNELVVLRVDKMSAFLDTPSHQLCCPEAEFGPQIHFDSPWLPRTAFPYALPFRPLCNCGLNVRTMVGGSPANIQLHMHASRIPQCPMGRGNRTTILLGLQHGIGR